MYKFLITSIPFFLSNSMHDSSTASHTRTFFISTGIFAAAFFFISKRFFCNERRKRILLNLYFNHWVMEWINLTNCFTHRKILYSDSVKRSNLTELIWRWCPDVIKYDRVCFPLSVCSASSPLPERRTYCFCWLSHSLSSLSVSVVCVFVWLSPYAEWIKPSSHTHLNWICIRMSAGGRLLIHPVKITESKKNHSLIGKVFEIFVFAVRLRLHRTTKWEHRMINHNHVQSIIWDSMKSFAIAFQLRKVRKVIKWGKIFAGFI